MSSTAEAEAEAVEADVCCANCGIAEVDDIKLEDCTDCDLVKYCTDKCREDHREQHEEECNNRKALLHDRKLFTQPDETHHGECPLCFLLLPIDPRKSTFHTCCSQTICLGCLYANAQSNGDTVKARRCPFCREPVAVDDHRKRMMKRIKENDPAAMTQTGVRCFFEGDYDAAFKYLTKAVELGYTDAHYRVGSLYMKGEGVEKDEEKAVYHFEKAAMRGHPYARHDLGRIESNNGSMERAVKHFIIAAKLGYEGSMKALWKHYSAGNITKEELDATLRSHQAAINATKSEQRDAGEAIARKLGLS